MRYIDTGSRDPQDALGTWLGGVLLGPHAVSAIRVQTGFFGAGALGYFENTLGGFSASDGHTRFLVGSNDGETPRAAVEGLMAVAGFPRPGMMLGVASFKTGFFHPKVYHFERADGSATAYVGSANLTPAGARSLHVEAGLILDTHEGDPPVVLTSIADTIDAWFTETRGGFYPVETSADLDALVAAGVLGAPPPQRPHRTVKPATGGKQHAQPARSLTPLVALPPIQMSLPVSPASPPSSPSAVAQPTPAAPVSIPPTASRVNYWSKTLSGSDAQRRAGHQSNLIALTQGDYRGQIDQTQYFRHDLFGAETWTVETTVSKAPLEVAYVSIDVEVDGVNQGPMTFRISHAIHRESGTNSPTTELHLEPLAILFAQSDMTGRKLELARYDDGSYTLTIS